MVYFALALLLGNACLLLFKTLPSSGALLLLLTISLSALTIFPKASRGWLILLVAFSLGLSWNILTARQVLESKLSEDFINQPVTIIGTIDSIPETKNQQLSFIIQTKQIVSGEKILNKATRVRLSWYFPHHSLKVGDCWQLKVRLKKPINTGSFDYQKWLFEQRIIAIGYVQTSKDNRLLKTNYHFKGLDNFREYIANGIQKSLNGKPLEGLIEALAVGVRTNITEEQWSVLRGTGTNHLFAIAGLHIGFVSGFIYFIVSFIWRRIGRLPLYLPSPIIAVLAALVSAIAYSALAGFSLPTQRAVIMTAVFLLATLCRKKIPLWHSWSLALILVLIYDPLAVLSASFWMSFSAVALIIYGISGRLYQKNIWRHWLYPQWVIAIGLIPISLLFFQQVSLANFIANAIAIPWVGLLVLPLSLLGGLAWVIWPATGTVILICAVKLLGIIWPLLKTFAQLDWLQWYTDITQPWVLITAIIAVYLLLAPRGFPGRWLGILWAFPLIFWQPAKPKPGEVWLNVLNVGAGMAVVTRSDNNISLYESGIKPAANNDIVLPYLQQLGVKKIDNLIINLAANNNSILSLLSKIPIKQVFLNAISDNIKGDITLCTNSTSWKTGDINYIVSGVTNNQGNNIVCSLSIQVKNNTVLIIDGVKIKNNFTSPIARPDILITTYKNSNQTLINTIESLNPKFLILSSQEKITATNLLLNAKIYSNAEQRIINLQLTDNLLVPEIDYLVTASHIWN